MRTPDGQVSINRVGGGSVEVNKYMRDDGSYWISGVNDGIDPRDRPGYNRLSRDDVDYNYKEISPALQEILDGKGGDPYVPPAPEDMPEPPADVLLPPDSEIAVEKNKRRGGRAGRGGGKADPGFDPYPSGGEGNQSGNSGNGSGNNVIGDGNQLGDGNSQANNNKVKVKSSGGSFTVDGDGNTFGDVNLSNNSVNFAEQKFDGAAGNRFLKQLAKRGAFGNRMAGGIEGMFPTLD